MPVEHFNEVRQVLESLRTDPGPSLARLAASDSFPKIAVSEEDHYEEKLNRDIASYCAIKRQSNVAKMFDHEKLTQ